MTSFQSSELTKLPVVENSQLFAQRVHSARYTPYVCMHLEMWVEVKVHIPCACARVCQ